MDISILDEISNKSIIPWPEFSREKFKFVLSSYNNSSTPGPDKLSWNHLKTIFNDIECLNTFVQMANACINLGYWLSHFKTSTTIIIPKPNKKSYDSPKSFRPIVSSSQTVDLVSLYFIFYFYFYFVLFSYFSIFRTARIRVRSDLSHCHISHNMMV